MLSQCALELSAAELRLDALGNASRDVVLDRKHVAEITIVLACPDLRSRACIHKLHGNPDLAAGPAHAALKTVSGTKLLCRRHGVADPLSAKPRRVAGDDGKSSPA